MIEIDESEWIGFFGVLPEPQSLDEREFFAAPHFVKRVDGMEISVSLSAHLRDLRITLRTPQCETPLLELAVPGVHAVSFDRDTARPWLRVSTDNHGIVCVAIEPTITVICDGCGPW